MGLYVYRVIVAVIIINTLAMPVHRQRPVRGSCRRTCSIIEVVSLAVFGAEYVARLWACVESPHYQRGAGVAGPPAATWVAPAALIEPGSRWCPSWSVHIAGADMRSLAMLRLLRV